MNPAQQQVLDRVSQATNILVTVSPNPSVDQLAAAIGLTLLLNRMEKHASAVFSGKVPSTLEFLQPSKTISNNVDGLRDFIISLDKEKADKLRYKVEDQVVRIFITPYKTTLSEKDLIFSQGDFNVEVVIALGVADRSHIDAAITAHGRILHDASLISIAAGSTPASNMGQINWHEQAASSLCEMVALLADSFGSDLIDNQMATAFLTGIVAETKRFSNQKTSPKTMTISAQLMAAGANQQLIVSKLEPPVQTQKYQPTAKKHVHAQPQDQTAGKPEATLQEGVLNIDHSSNGQKPSGGNNANINIDEKGNFTSASTPQALAEPESPEPESPDQESSEPAIAASETPQVTATASTMPAPVPDEAPQPETSQPEASKPASPHHELLDPSETPLIGSQFSSNAKPEWEDPYNSVPYDPLNPQSDSGPANKAGGQDNKALTNRARKDAEAERASQPFDPTYEPQAQSPDMKDESEPPSSDDKPAEAPPFPPPIEKVASQPHNTAN